MYKVFRVEITSRAHISAELDLPAQPYKLLDTLDKLRLEEGEVPRWELLESHDALHLFHHLDQGNGSLEEANALAQRLADLDDTELAIVGGLADMEQKPLDQPFPLSRLIDLAYSTDCCHLVKGVVTDAQLGRFFAENGFISEVESLPDAAFELLDFERIGREHRQSEGGVFTCEGYVLRHDELEQVYKTLDLTLKKPDYVMLAERPDGGWVKLPLPVGAAVMDEPVQCVDCAVPTLTGQTAMLSNMDTLAHRLAELEMDGELPKYKAVLETVHCDDMTDALLLVGALDQYSFSPKLLEPEDAAIEYLQTMLAEDEVERLVSYLDLRRYGGEVVEQRGGVLTPYGLLEREDGQPIHSMNEQSEPGGMEMKF